MQDNYVIGLTRPLVEGLVDLAVEFDISNMEDLVHAILKEKLSEYNISVEDESVSHTHKEDEDEELISALEEASKDTSKDTSTYNSLGPSVDEAPEQMLSEAEKASISDVEEVLKNKDELSERMDKIEGMFSQLMGKLSQNPFQGR